MDVPKLATCLWFDGNAEEAVRFYAGLLPDTRPTSVHRFALDTPGGKAGEVMMVEFILLGAPALALNGGPYFRPTPAVSFVVACDDQAEIDRLWDGLGDGGEAMSCGWITDRYGFAWQIVPAMFMALMRSGDAPATRRAMQALLDMVKIDIAALEAAARG